MGQVHILVTKLQKPSSSNNQKISGNSLNTVFFPPNLHLAFSIFSVVYINYPY